MKAVVLHAYGGVDQLSYEEVPDPKPQSGEVLVRVIATSVNPIDFKMRRGDAKDRMPLKLPAILGRDVSGQIVAVGSDATGFEAGQHVFGFVNNTYAELVACKAADLAVLPAGFDAINAAALPLVVTTGSQLIEVGVKPVRGETVLVTGALGSVGRTAVHVAKERGAIVIAGVRSKELSAAGELGADRVVAIDDQNAIDALPRVDAIADTVGGETIGKLIPKLKPNGVLASVVGKPAAAEGRDIRVEAVVAKPDPIGLLRIAHDVGEGKLSIPIGRRLKLSEIREAHQLAEKGGVGKIILLP